MARSKLKWNNFVFLLVIILLVIGASALVVGIIGGTTPGQRPDAFTLNTQSKSLQCTRVDSPQSFSAKATVHCASMCWTVSVASMHKTMRRWENETKRESSIRAHCVLQRHVGHVGMSHVHHSPFQFSFHFFASIYCCTNYFISTSIEVYNWSTKKSTSMHADDARCIERNSVHDDEHTVNRRRHTIISHVQYKIIFMCFIVTFLSLFTVSSILRVPSLSLSGSSSIRPTIIGYIGWWCNGVCSHRTDKYENYME